MRKVASLKNLYYTYNNRYKIV